MKRRPFLASIGLAGLSYKGREEIAYGDPGGENRVEPRPWEDRLRGRVVAAAAGGEDRKHRPALDTAIGSLFDLPPRDAWRRLFRPTDRVAIKINCLSAPRLAPGRSIVDALVAGIRSAGVPASEIVLFERTSRELESAGFPIQTGEGEVRCFGTDALRGGGYGRTVLEHRSIGSLFSRVLTDFADILISVGVCKDHDLSGISGGCKNLYGVIHNPNRYHDNRCDPYLADLLDHPAVRPRYRLTVIDAVRAQCHGGPAFVARHLFHPGRILLGVDPLAVDRVVWTMIERERSRRGMKSLAESGREPTWLASAAELGIGVAEEGGVTLQEVEG